MRIQLMNRATKRRPLVIIQEEPITNESGTRRTLYHKHVQGVLGIVGVLAVVAINRRLG